MYAFFAFVHLNLNRQFLGTDFNSNSTINALDTTLAVFAADTESNTTMAVLNGEPMFRDDSGR